MKPELIFVPVLCHFYLVIAVYLLLLKRKLKAVKAGKVDRKRAALNDKAWDDECVLKTSNNLDNQFQAPLLFYMLCGVLYAVGGVNQATLMLAWFFVFSRYLHAYIHNTSNYVPYRMKSFTAGVLSLVGLSAVACFRLWASYL